MAAPPVDGPESVGRSPVVVEAPPVRGRDLGHFSRIPCVIDCAAPTTTGASVSQCLIAFDADDDNDVDLSDAATFQRSLTAP